MTALSEDAIHYIGNPNDSTSMSLHIYGGDFSALVDKCSLWNADQHQQTRYCFDGPLCESIKNMKLHNKTSGPDALGMAMPKAKPLVDAL